SPNGFPTAITHSPMRGAWSAISMNLNPGPPSTLSSAISDCRSLATTNGIEEVTSRPDLADRSIRLTLEPIPKNKRRPEREIMTKFESARPKILGALLDVMVRGLKDLPSVELDELPRMADFAQWVVACETGLWEKGTFIKAYGGNTDETLQEFIEGD